MIYLAANAFHKISSAVRLGKLEPDLKILLARFNCFEADK